MKRLSQHHKDYLELRRWLHLKRQKIAFQKQKNRLRKPGSTMAEAPVSGLAETHLLKVRCEDNKGRRTILAARRTAMPKNFCLETNYEESARCLIDVRERLLKTVAQRLEGISRTVRRGRYVESYYDFTTIERCSPSAALVLASEYDRARTLIDWSIPVIDLHRWHPALVSLLDEIGFFKLLAIRRPVRDSAARTVEVLQFRTGDVVGQDDAQVLVESLAKIVLDADPTTLLDAKLHEARMRLFGALVEATENTCHHAYPLPARALTVNRWWMTGAADRNAKHLNLVVFDQGRSIPATLPSWDQYPWVESRLQRLKRMALGVAAIGNEEEFDGARIRLAMDAPRSSTGHSFRGKGFPAFRQVIDESRHGRLRIISRRGEYIYEKGKHPRNVPLTVPLNGTLVEWDLWL